VTTQERPPRRDAARNRARLVAVATETFRTEGLDVGVDEIARRAGVGIATLYRHFPTKTDLVVAVLQELTDDLALALRAAQHEREPLHAALAVALRLQAANRAMLDAFATGYADDRARMRLAERMLGVLTPVAAAGHASGELRQDFDADDLLVAVRMLGAATTAADPERQLAVVLRGLRPDA
jgi:AcrR family transcriptional regulator